MNRAISLFLLIVGTGWAFYPSLVELSQKWLRDPQYSHGFLVPCFAAYLAYIRGLTWSSFAGSMPVTGSLFLLLAGFARGTAGMLYFLPLDGVALVLTIAGVLALLGGREVMRITWPAILYLFFMVPLPYSVERMLGAELQQLATGASTFLLQTTGLPAISEGNLILIDEIRLGVVEACSGLRMLMTFLAFAVAAVCLLERHWLVKLIILLSAIPIALLVNVLRITATGIAHVSLHDSPYQERVLNFIHDFNGWMMMPLGLGFLMIELWWLRNLIIEKKSNFSARTKIQSKGN
jgi:exosortase